MDLRSLPLGLILLSSVVSGTEPPPTPKDFAYGLQLTVEPNGALYGLELPEVVYNGITRGDLGDLRIFNAAGEVLPHVLQRPTTPVAKPPAPLVVPLFPLYGDVDRISEKVRFRVRIGAGGALVELTGNTPASATTPIQAYLLDLSQLRTRIPASLRLHWDMPPPAGFVAQVNIQASDDLTHWRSAGTGALADLDFGGQRLQRTTLVPTIWRRYLRFAWPGALAGTLLREVQVVFVGRGIQEPERQWREVVGHSTTGSHDSFLFDVGGLVPADRIQVRLPQSNTLVPVQIHSRQATTGGAWVTRYRGSLYDLSIDEVRLRNDPISLPALAHRQWRLVTSGEASGLGTGMPVLELGWVPYRLLFLARGAPPYLLAYGSGRIGPLAGEEVALLGTLARDPRRVKAARISGPASLTGEVARTVPRPPLPWMRILLWGVLIVCVSVLAWMARRISLQIRTTATSEQNGTSSDQLPPGA